MSSGYKKVLVIGVLLAIVGIIASLLATGNDELIVCEESIVLVTDTMNQLDDSFISNEYASVEVEFIATSDFLSYDIEDNILLAIDIDVLDDQEIKNKVNEVLETDYVLFIGEYTIDKLSTILGYPLTQEGVKFTSSSMQAMRTETVTMSDEQFSILKYTENIVLKPGIEIVNISDGKEEYYIKACADFILEEDNYDRYGAYGSYKRKYYYENEDASQLESVELFLQVYKLEDESDQDKEYYVFKTSILPNSNSDALKVKHIENNDSVILDCYPTQTTKAIDSYSDHIDGYIDNIVYYDGDKIMISIEQDASNNLAWNIVKESLDGKGLTDTIMLASQQTFLEESPVEFTFEIQLGNEDMLYNTGQQSIIILE